jgi:hypothetical protein
MSAKPIGRSAAENLQTPDDSLPIVCAIICAIIRADYCDYGGDDRASNL